MLLLPFIEFDEEGKEKISTYTALYNFNLDQITTIEPTKEGYTLITSKFHPDIYFDVPIEKFLVYITKLNKCDLFFLDDVKKSDKGIISVFNKLGIIIEGYQV